MRFGAIVRPPSFKAYAPIPGHSPYGAAEDGSIARLDGGLWYQLAGNIESTGYRRYCLFVNQKRLCRFGQRLVLAAYKGECPAGMEACHNNGSRDDNRIANLRWGTRPSNRLDMILHGTQQMGEAHGMAKITEKQALALIAAKKQAGDKWHWGLKQKAAELGIGRATAQKILRGQLWKHLPR